MRSGRLVSTALLSLLLPTLLAAWWESPQPRELGDVEWLRSFEVSTARSRENGKPLFALFQEIPGCQTCVSFGDQVLSHPLLVEAIESEFVPVAIYNNRPGEDAALLARFGEPAWNNPVVRFFDGQGRDLIARRDRVWEAGRIGERMIAALEAADRSAPAYLRDAVDELRPHRSDQAVFRMHCFWSGEACLGQIPGLLSSRAGFLAGTEVVELSFDRDVLSYEEVLEQAAARGCADGVYSFDALQHEAARRVFGGAAQRATASLRPAPSADQKRALRRGRYRELRLTPRQALRVNALLAAGRSPRALLSPRQLAALGVRPARQ